MEKELTTEIGRIKILKPYIWNQIMFGKQGFDRTVRGCGDVDYHYFLGETEKAIKICSHGITCNPFGITLQDKRGLSFVWIPKSVVEFKKYKMKIMGNTSIGTNSDLFKDMKMNIQPFKQSYWR